MIQQRSLAEIAQQARRAYVERIAGGPAGERWWDAVIVTAGSARQASRYEQEIQRRREQGKLPSGVVYLVVPDLDDERIGSGGATIHGLHALAAAGLAGTSADSFESWWQERRVLMIHSGGDSRRLPAYSLSGKLFSALPVKTPWGEVSTVFDEMLAFSTTWARRVSSGLVVSAGDVILTFDGAQLDWERPGVCGAAIRQPVEVGSQHGVYVLGDQGRVYSFLQKPSAAEVRAAGGMLAGECVALDIGLLHFDAATAGRLTELAGAHRRHGLWEVGPGILRKSGKSLPVIDLYQHMTLALTREWTPAPDSHPALRAVAKALRGVPFWCSLVEGDFAHVGTTSHFHKLLTEESNFTRLYLAQQRLGSVNPPGLQSAGVVIDSVFAQGGELGPGTIAIECHLRQPVHAARGAILHGLTGVLEPLEIPEDTVVHQLPVLLKDGRRGVVLRVYGVDDDPKLSVAAGHATWLGRPILDSLRDLGIDVEAVWLGIPLEERCLWNASLFAFGPIEEAWSCARWMMGLANGYSAERWRRAERLSLASSAAWADSQALADARSWRMHANWQRTAVALAESGTDVRPLLAHAPGVAALAETGRALRAAAAGMEAGAPTEAGSRHFQASLFLGQAGLEEEAEQARAAAYACVQKAVDAGGGQLNFDPGTGRWRRHYVRVSGPPRIDMGGGWSDTPPFCLDWGGTVLNIAITVNGEYPIATTVRRLDEPLIRCISGETGETAQYGSTEEIMAPPSPGSPFSIPRAALQLAGIARPGEILAQRLGAYGGGLEIRTEVNLPMGSGLGTSSILAATLLRALAEMAGVPITEHSLSDQVMRLEQLMTTGGGWQDQVGGIFPGAKLAASGPGLRQRLRVEPVGWSRERQAEFMRRFVIYYTGIRRIAKDLLAQVVGSYLAREVATVQVLHSIKTLAVEMSHAMKEGEWEYLGQLLDRHWQLNQKLDPHTTNAPIDALLAEIRPFLSGAKLAGAGGGGFLMLLAKGPAEATALRARLATPTEKRPGALYEFDIASKGLRVETDQLGSHSCLPPLS